MVFTFIQCAVKCTLSDINIIHFFTFTMCVLKEQSAQDDSAHRLGHEAERGLVFYVREARFVVQFSGVFRGPDFSSPDDVLLPELLLIRPGQRVTGQRGEAVVRVAGRGRP